MLFFTKKKKKKKTAPRKIDIFQKQKIFLKKKLMSPF